MSRLQLRVSGKAVLAVAMVLVACGMFFAGSAQASPPRYVAMHAGPGREYPQVGLYDSYAPPVQPQCWTETGPSYDIWLRTTYQNVTGFLMDTPFSPLHRSSSTPPCPQPPASCTSSGFQNTVVQWSNGPGKQNTSWYVNEQCQRKWIPDIKTYWCLRGQGVTDKGVQSAAVLDSLPDQHGVWITCTNQVV